MTESEYKCCRCGLIIKSTSNPSVKLQGPCPSNTQGEHSWSKI